MSWSMSRTGASAGSRKRGAGTPMPPRRPRARPAGASGGPLSSLPMARTRPSPVTSPGRASSRPVLNNHCQLGGDRALDLLAVWHQDNLAVARPGPAAARRLVRLRPGSSGAGRAGGAGPGRWRADDCAQRPGHGSGSLIATGVSGLSRSDSPRTSTFSGSPSSTRYRSSSWVSLTRSCRPQKRSAKASSFQARA